MSSMSRLWGRFLSQGTRAVEVVVAKAARNVHSGKTYTAGVDGGAGRDVAFHVKKQLGQGVFGVVYDVQLGKATREFRRAHPDLFLPSGEPRKDLVIKFANDVHLPSDIDPFKKALNDEVVATKTAEDFAHGRLHYPETLFVGGGKQPFIIKRKLTSSPITKLARGPEGLEPKVEAAILRDVYQPALAIKTETGGKKALDIKADNIFYDAKTDRAEMVEITWLPLGLRSFFFQPGEGAYLDYVRAAKRPDATAVPERQERAAPNLWA